MPYDPTIPFLDVYPREIKIHVHTKAFTCMFIAALFIIAPKRKQPKCSPTDEWIKYGIIGPCYNMGGPWKHSAKWKKPDRKAIRCMIPFLWNVQNRHP